MKEKGEKISMLTAYDYSTARLVDEAGVNSILVGDSLGNVMLGYEDTIAVTVEDMIHHGRAVARGAKNALVVVDMPFLSYQTSVYDAVVNAGRIMKETHCGAVKLEGGAVVCPQIKAIVDASIPVCAHLGLTPQSINAFGGFKVQGKTVEAAQKLIDDAKAVEEAGAFAAALLCPAVALRYLEHRDGTPYTTEKLTAVFPLSAGAAACRLQTLRASPPVPPADSEINLLLCLFGRIPDTTSGTSFPAGRKEVL